MITCPHCGTAVRQDSRFCSFCGLPLKVTWPWYLRSGEGTDRGKKRSVNEDHALRVELSRQCQFGHEWLGWYLVVKCDQPEIGEEFTTTTGSVSIVAQLVRAHVAGWLPLLVVPKQSEKPTRKGYRPMHLELVRSKRTRAVVIDQAPENGPSRQEQSRERRRERIAAEVRAGAEQGA